MKKRYDLIFLILVLFANAGCGGKGGAKKDAESGSEISSVTDTGFTGIKKYRSGQLVVKEVTFKNGVRDGLTKTYYPGGQLYQTFWYKNNLREDSACWYFLEGQVFRTTPYKHDTLDGIQKQYYRTGEIRARIGYKKGLRTTYFQEFDRNGKLMGGYPDIVATPVDEYKTKGSYKIGLELSDRSPKVKFYRGELADGRFDTTKCKTLSTNDGKALLELKKSGSDQTRYVNIIAEIITPFGNKYLAIKNIELPYKDLK
jgi:hypothetical protein